MVCHMLLPGFLSFTPSQFLLSSKSKLYVVKPHLVLFYLWVFVPFAYAILSPFSKPAWWNINSRDDHIAHIGCLMNGRQKGLFKSFITHSGDKKMPRQSHYPPRTFTYKVKETIHTSPKDETKQWIKRVMGIQRRKGSRVEERGKLTSGKSLIRRK